MLESTKWSISSVFSFIGGGLSALASLAVNYEGLLILANHSFLRPIDSALTAVIGLTTFGIGVTLAISGFVTAGSSAALFLLGKQYRVNARRARISEQQGGDNPRISARVVEGMLARLRELRSEEQEGANQLNEITVYNDGHPLIPPNNALPRNPNAALQANSNHNFQLPELVIKNLHKFTEPMKRYVLTFQNKESNSDAFDRLNLADKENEFADLMCSVMNIPVRLDSELFNLMTLLNWEEVNGKRSHPTTRDLFVLTEIQAARDIQDDITTLIADKEKAIAETVANNDFEPEMTSEKSSTEDTKNPEQEKAPLLLNYN